MRIIICPEQASFSLDVPLKDVPVDKPLPKLLDRGTNIVFTELKYIYCTNAAQT
jgi:hypothetical protein